MLDVCRVYDELIVVNLRGPFMYLESRYIYGPELTVIFPQQDSDAIPLCDGIYCNSKITIRGLAFSELRGLVDDAGRRQQKRRFADEGWRQRRTNNASPIFCAILGDS
jgi:hypothetical protein